MDSTIPMKRMLMTMMMKYESELNQSFKTITIAISKQVFNIITKFLIVH